MTDVVDSSMIPAPSVPDATASTAAPTADPIAELTAALAGRDQFLAFVDHELRNALAPAVLLADQFDALARDPRASQTVASRAALLTRSLRRFVTTVHWVAEVTELCCGKLHLDPTPLDLAQTVAEVCRELAAEATACGVALVVEPGAPVAGSWDRARLKQLVTCLVSHAIHHAGGRVELCVRDRGGDAELVVRDHGPGLDPCALARLFDPFDPERHARGGGRDLGLWTARTLASAMRGSVTANSCSDGGACFCVVVPRG